MASTIPPDAPAGGSAGPGGANLPVAPALPGLGAGAAAPGAATALYNQLDSARRWQGRLLDALGFAPQETPSHVLLANALFTLKAYHEPNTDGPDLLLVPAPIKRAYLWDLAPEVSVVRTCLQRGARVHLLQWEAPEDDQQEVGIAGYADHAIGLCLDAMQAAGGRRPVVMFGHSLGGTLAAIFAALHSDRLQALVLLGAPLHFGPDAGVFTPALSSAPAAEEMTAGLGNPPGSFLTAASVLAAPQTFVADRLADLWNSVGSAEALRTHFLVERWTLDEMPIPRQLFDEVLDLLYREDCLTEGTLLVAGQPVTPAQLTVPLLNVIEEKSRIVPPGAVLPFHERCGSRDRQVFWYGGDVGVGLQHVGMLVGRSAHDQLWPEILEWSFAHAGARQTH